MAGRKIAAVLIAVTIAATLFMPINSAVVGNTGVQTVENETSGLTASFNETQDLDGYNIVEDSETVERHNSTSDSWETLTRGTDYEMNYGPGEIEVLNSDNVDEGDDIRASYDYEATNSTTATVANLVPLFVALLILGVLAGKVTDMM